MLRKYSQWEVGHDGRELPLRSPRRDSGIIIVTGYLKNRPDIFARHMVLGYRRYSFWGTLGDIPVGQRYRTVAVGRWRGHRAWQVDHAAPRCLRLCSRARARCCARRRPRGNARDPSGCGARCGPSLRPAVRHEEVPPARGSRLARRLDADGYVGCLRAVGMGVGEWVKHIGCAMYWRLTRKKHGCGASWDVARLQELAVGVVEVQVECGERSSTRTNRHGLHLHARVRSHPATLPRQVLTAPRIPFSILLMPAPSHKS